MNSQQLKSRATRLMNRLAALGFTKDGKPLVIDQAFELVAAEEGCRNQHELRARLEKERGADRSDAPSEVQAHFDWAALLQQQGWSDASQLSLLMDFIKERELMMDFVGFAQKAADIEEVEELSVAEQDALEGVGYSIAISDFGLPYWQLDEGDASEDFDTVEKAWRDAWKDAQGKAAKLAGMSLKDTDSLSEAARISLIRRHLGPDSEANVRRLADDAYEAYDFTGFGGTVASDSGWETCTGSGSMTRTVYLENEEADEPSIRVRFTVEVANGVVVRTSVNT